MDCFDADVLIYAAEPGHTLGARVMALLATAATGDRADQPMGSVVLMTEVLTKPERNGHHREASALRELLSKLALRTVDVAVANLSVSLGAKYRLSAADAIHLATAVHAGADRFITNNRRDFDRDIAEVEIVFPEALPEPG